MATEPEPEVSSAAAEGDPPVSSPRAGEPAPSAPPESPSGDPASARPGLIDRIWQRVAGRVDRATLGESLGLWGAFSAMPIAVVGVLDISVTQKLIWTAIFAIDAAVVTGIVMSLPSRSGHGGGSRIKPAVLGLVVAIPVSIVIGLVAGSTWEDDVRLGLERPCTTVGTGSPEYEAASSKPTNDTEEPQLSDAPSGRSIPSSEPIIRTSTAPRDRASSWRPGRTKPLS
jgi:hypothetical protein